MRLILTSTGTVKMQETRIPIKQAFSNAPEPSADVSSCAESEPFALQVTDDSMEPEFPKGCVIIIDPSIAPVDGAFVLARDSAGEYLFRQYCVLDGIATLQALQSGLAAISLGSPAQIEGVITQRSGGRRRSNKRY